METVHFKALFTTPMEMSMKDTLGTIKGMGMAPTTTTPQEKFIRESGNKICGMEEAPTLSYQEKYASMGSGNAAFCRVKLK